MINQQCGEISIVPNLPNYSIVGVAFHGELCTCILQLTTNLQNTNNLMPNFVRCMNGPRTYFSCADLSDLIGALFIVSFLRCICFGIYLSTVVDNSTQVLLLTVLQIPGIQYFTTRSGVIVARP